MVALLPIAYVAAGVMASVGVSAIASWTYGTNQNSEQMLVVVKRNDIAAALRVEPEVANNKNEISEVLKTVFKISDPSGIDAKSADTNCTNYKKTLAFLRVERPLRRRSSAVALRQPRQEENLIAQMAANIRRATAPAEDDSENEEKKEI